MEIKQVTQVTNIGVILLSLTILGLSGWFLRTALNDDITSLRQDEGPAIETLNLTLFEQVRADMEKKKAGGDPLPSKIRNPFVRTLRAPAAVPAPLPEPEPVPPPVSEPEPPPPPAT